MKKKSLEKIQEVFIRNFGHLDLKIPEDDLINRRKGSMPYGSGKIFYLFGEEGGREYFEYYAHHRIGGDSHRKIYDNGESVDLDELESMVIYSPKIPGDRERREAENAEKYQNTLDDLNAKGMFSSASMPGALAIKSHIMTEMLKKGKKPADE